MLSRTLALMPWQPSATHGPLLDGPKSVNRRIAYRKGMSDDEYECTAKGLVGPDQILFHVSLIQVDHYCSY